MLQYLNFNIVIGRLGLPNTLHRQRVYIFKSGFRRIQKLCHLISKNFHGNGVSMHPVEYHNYTHLRATRGSLAPIYTQNFS